MSEYIERETLIDLIKNGNGRIPDWVEEYISECPTADVEPVVHGKWKHVAGMNSKCSECGHYFPVTEFEKRPFDINYCPNCGAKMD